MDEIRTGTEYLLKKFIAVRKRTEELCEPLLPEDFVVQPNVDVSPPKWHLAHTTWFFETFVLKDHYRNYRIFDPDYNFLFNSYYESIGERTLRPNRGNLTRPSVNELMEYRRYVTEFMKELLENAPNEKVLQLTEIGLQHEQQHQELLVTDLKYILGNNPLFPVYKKNLPSAEPQSYAASQLLNIPGGIYEIGYQGNEFSFDNEQPAHKVYIGEFKINKHLVTNKEYLEFINDGGYQNFRWWLMEGWELKKMMGWQAPLYWFQKDGAWQEYTLAGLKKLNPDTPVTHISFYEAEAYARWAGKRLLTEFEWEAAAGFLNPQSCKGNFLESGNFHPIAENGNSCMSGNTWEWTYSSYHPYPGYEREEGPLGEYNGKFMINQMVLRGGSCATPEDHFRITYRNFFHPDKRWQFTGIRLAEKE